MLGVLLVDPLGAQWRPAKSRSGLWRPSYSGPYQSSARRLWHPHYSAEARHLYDGILDSFAEALEMEHDDEQLEEVARRLGQATTPSMDRRRYFSELLCVQGELVKLQE